VTAGTMANDFQRPHQSHRKTTGPTIALKNGCFSLLKHYHLKLIFLCFKRKKLCLVVE
jgi:hypothetical protein